MLITALTGAALKRTNAVRVKSTYETENWCLFVENVFGSVADTIYRHTHTPGSSL